MKKQPSKRQIKEYLERAKDFQFLALLGWECVEKGEITFDDWLRDLQPVAEKYRARLLVVMWPASVPLPHGVPSMPCHDGWRLDLDIVLDVPPYTVTSIRQPSTPESMSRPDLIWQRQDEHES
jgi:hypothetical protein